MVTTTDTPDGERIARVEARLENLEQQIVEIRQDIRELRREMLQQIQGVRDENRGIRDEMRDIRNRMDKQFLWILGVMFTMWISLFVLIATFMIAIINKLS